MEFWIVIYLIGAVSFVYREVQLFLRLFGYKLALWRQVKFAKSDTPNRIPVILEISGVLLAALGIFLNFGFVRLVLFIPMVIHMWIFCFTFSRIQKWENVSGILLGAVFVVSYVAIYLFLPDGADSPSSVKSFFSLVSDSNAIETLRISSLWSGGLHFILMVYILLFGIKIRFLGWTKNKDTRGQ